MTEYTVYALHGQVRVDEAELVASVLPEDARVILVTTDQDEAQAAIGQAVLEGYAWAGCDWLGPAEFHCDRCRRPAEPDGQGGYRHVEPVDAAVCEFLSGGGSLSKLVTD